MSEAEKSFRALLSDFFRAIDQHGARCIPAHRVRLEAARRALPPDLFRESGRWMNEALREALDTQEREAWTLVRQFSPGSEKENEERMLDSYGVVNSTRLIQGELAELTKKSRLAR